jgi:diaminopropionate ammonia-lyase
LTPSIAAKAANRLMSASAKNSRRISETDLSEAMLILNRLPDHRRPLEPADAEALGERAAADVARFLDSRPEHRPTPLLALPALARELGLGEIHLKDESQRLGLCSFKALGGAYAVVRLALEEVGRRLDRPVDVAQWKSEAVRKIASGMTFCCATDGNHGRSVAQGAALIGAKAAIFVHAGVSAERAATIAALGAEVIRARGGYDDAVAESARAAERSSWTLVSDTSWEGYERPPFLVMQGYTTIVAEALSALARPPTHVFIQAGVGGFAAAVAAHFALVLGPARPTFVVVEPTTCASFARSARLGRSVDAEPGPPTVMAMLECRRNSLIAWRVLSRVADAFLTVEDEDAIAAMNRLARPLGDDPAIVAGESGAAGFAGMTRAALDPDSRAALGLESASRALIVNSEGATDRARYRSLVGAAPEDRR